MRSQGCSGRSWGYVVATGAVKVWENVRLGDSGRFPKDPGGEKRVGG